MPATTSAAARSGSSLPNIAYAAATAASKPSRFVHVPEIDDADDFSGNAAVVPRARCNRWRRVDHAATQLRQRRHNLGFIEGEKFLDERALRRVAEGEQVLARSSRTRKSTSVAPRGRMRKSASAHR